jgi:GTPase SAR1 family protein
VRVIIVGFVGKMGSGKTLSCVREIHKYYLRGYKVMSNFHLNFPHTLINFEELYMMAEQQTEMNNVVIALDEVHILLDSRSGMGNTNKVMTFWLNQTRKMGVKLFYTTQYEHQVDKRLRSGTDIIIFCEGLHVMKGGVDYFVCHNEMVIGDEFRREIFLGNDYFPLYDTKEVVKFINRKDLKKKDGVAA